MSAKTKKRFLQIVDQMNLDDTSNKTENVIRCDSFVSANYTPQGTKVTMGLPGNHIFDIESGKKIAVLLLIDYNEYMKIENNQ